MNVKSKIPQNLKLKIFTIALLLSVSLFFSLFPRTLSQGAYPPANIKYFADNSYWYMKIKNNPSLHPNNDKLINWLLNNHADYPGIQWQSWTNVVYGCHETTTLYSVYNEDHSRYESIPFPDPYPIDIPAESDHAVTIIDWYREKIWDI